MTIFGHICVCHNRGCVRWCDVRCGWFGWLLDVCVVGPCLIVVRCGVMVGLGLVPVGGGACV